MAPTVPGTVATVKSTVIGNTMPILELTLDAGESGVTEGGGVSWFTPGFAIQTSTRFGSGGRGGFMSGLKRMLGGGNLFLSQYTAQTNGRMLALTTDLPG